MAIWMHTQPECGAQSAGSRRFMMALWFTRGHASHGLRLPRLAGWWSAYLVSLTPASELRLQDHMAPVKPSTSRPI